jgi:hypothetical protein
MDVEDLINRAVTDEAFASELAKQATAASRAGIHSETWREYVSQFADTPEELEDLVPPKNAVAIKWTTITTTTTITSVGCYTTTTTTTTTEVPKLCNPPTKKIAFEVAGDVVFPLAGFPVKARKNVKGKQD